MEAEESHASKRSRGGGGPGPWNHPASRIYRVSRASGGKDRHSKVYTAKGLRDRRVRLSVSTAIQFYDLQDRLGFDQPSKAIEWLIKAADAAISELPTLDSSFPLPPKEENPGTEHEAEPADNGQLQQLTKSGCSSTSETSKGSVLSLSRSESRVKARERARERTAKENEHTTVCPSLNSQSSFTELLTGVGSGNNNAAAVTIAQMTSGGANCVQKQTRYLPVAATAAADYFAQASSSQSQLVPFNIAAAAAAAREHSEMQQYSFLQDHPVPLAAVAASGDYNLNFSISPGLAALNRGTLQSNSPSQLSQHHHHHQHLQRLSSPVDGANMPFYFGTAAPTAGAVDNQFPSGFDGRLQIFYGDGYRHSDVKGKGKS